MSQRRHDAHRNSSNSAGPGIIRPDNVVDVDGEQQQQQPQWHNSNIDIQPQQQQQRPVSSSQSPAPLPPRPSPRPGDQEAPTASAPLLAPPSFPQTRRRSSRHESRLAQAPVVPERTSSRRVASPSATAAVAVAAVDTGAGETLSRALPAQQQQQRRRRELRRESDGGADDDDDDDDDDDAGEQQQTARQRGQHQRSTLYEFLREDAARLGGGPPDPHPSAGPEPEREPVRERSEWGTGSTNFGAGGAEKNPTATGRIRRKGTKRPSHFRRTRDAVVARLRAFYQKIVVETILRQRPLGPSNDGRHILLDGDDGGDEPVDERTGRAYVGNFIRSGRYTAWDFLPKQLFFQFSKLGNFYFLVIGSLQLVPSWSTTGSWTTMGPLLAFVAFSMAKEGYDDYRRYQMDKSENRSRAWILRAPGAGARRRKHKHRPFWTWRKTEPPKIRHAHRQPPTGGDDDDDDDDGNWMQTQWQHLRVGDVVRLRRDDNVPADMVLLHATGPESVAYIETMALDGETNLKSKQACPLLAGRCGNADGIGACRARIVSEDPNIDLYSYEGRVSVGPETLPLSLANVVLRGSTLRNTRQAVGVVVNSGEECKIRMNAHRNVRTKSPAVQRLLNYLVFSVIVVLLGLSFGLTGAHYLVDPARRDAWYLDPVPFDDMFVGFLIMFNTLIPLSLYVSLEIVKIFQLYFLADIEMYDPVSDTPMVANTGTILENLGQVNYLFSDKTGTLTENVMRFKKMSVAGTACHHGSGCDPADPTTTEGPVDDDRRGLPPSPDAGPRGPPELGTSGLLSYVAENPDTEFSRRARHFLLCIALCHTCLPEKRGDGDAVAYQASSPDELALVEAARDLGFVLVDRAAHSVTLRVPQPDAPGGEVEETYEVLDVIEFSSARKCMSVVVRGPDGRVCVVCKGADSAIMSRLRQADLAREKARSVKREASTRKTMERRRMSRQSSELGGGGASHHPGFSHRPGNSSSSGSIRSRSRNQRRRSRDLNRWPFRLSNDNVAGDVFSPSPHEMPPGALAFGEPEPGEHGRPPRHGDDDNFLIDERVASSDAAVFERTFRHTDDFASEGLRTLLYGFAYLDEDDYQGWRQRYREATTSLANRQRRIEEVAAQIESGLELAGATAIEDKLQDGVPETIDKLRRAGIKVWMLTGDKRETAVNIGYSARVCQTTSEVYNLDAAAGDLRGQLSSILAALDADDPAYPGHSVLVVDGHTLGVIEGDVAGEESLPNEKRKGLPEDGEDGDDEVDNNTDDNRPGAAALFYDLITDVDSVICCRASPAQKAALVTQIKQRVPGSMTLAIGDGSNDIGMIQASHVGVGISGREGLQAARIADYSIAQFRFLQRLLLVHGRWIYGRTAKYILATFWKEFVFHLAQAHFQRFTLYTGTSLYEANSLAVFNVLFTSVPVIFMGIVHCDLQPETLLAFPELYASYGPRNRAFNLYKYVGWMAMAIVYSLALFWLFRAAYSYALFDNDNSLFAEGMVLFTASVMFINIKLLLFEVHNKNVLILLGFAISVIGWFVWNLLITVIYPDDMEVYIVNDTFLHDFGRQLFWWATVSMLLGVVTSAEYALQAFRRLFFPTDVDVMQQAEREGKVAELLAAQGGRDVERGDVEMRLLNSKKHGRGNP